MVREITERMLHYQIHWGDETALTNTDVRGRSYAPAGKTSVALTVGGTRQKLSVRWTGWALPCCAIRRVC